MQGCSLRCTQDCLNPHFLDETGGFAHSAEEIALAIQQIATQASVPVEGITMLGGEPTDQARGVAALFAAVRSFGMSTMLYSGLTYRALKTRNLGNLLALTDVLVDGPFIAKLYDERLNWRGSSNQHVRCLTDRYSQTSLNAAFQRQGKSISIRLGADGSISMSGLQSLEGISTVVS